MEKKPGFFREQASSPPAVKSRVSSPHFQLLITG